MINYDTSFKMNDRVEIIGGLYKGRIGVVVDYVPWVPRGLYWDVIARQGAKPKLGVYSIRVRFFRKILAFEHQMTRYIPMKKENRDDDELP